MKREARPRLRDRRTLILFAGIAVGTLVFAVAALAPPERMVQTPAAIGEPAAFEWSRRHWPWVIASAFSTTVLTICAYELLNLGLYYGFWRALDRNKFDAFFGNGAAERPDEGLIIIQGDRIDALLKEYVPNITELIKSRPDGRMFKARAWTNLWDTVGARSILKMFRELQLETPQLRTDERETPGEHTSLRATSKDELRRAPFVISLGLGYSQATLSHLSVSCAGWFRVGNDPDSYGDTIELLHNLVPDETAADIFKLSDCEGGYKRLIPSNWDIDKWAGGRDEIRDYAMILRHTHGDPEGQVHFVLAGFTERGTAHAAAYMARKWDELRERYITKQVKAGLGDFMVIIEGPSWGDNSLWREIGRLAVTPSKLKDISPKSVWGQRVQEPQ